VHRNERNRTDGIEWKVVIGGKGDEEEEEEDKIILGTNSRTERRAVKHWDSIANVQKLKKRRKY